MTEKKRPSVAEILAAARKNAGETAPAPAAEAPTAAPAEATPSAPAAPAASDAPAKPTAKPGERPNVKDILAAARAGKAADAPAAKPAAAKPAAAPTGEKPAAKPTGDKPKPVAKPAAAAAGGARDTASILAAARGASKPGPMTKAEAAAKGTPVAESAKGKPSAAPPMPPKPSSLAPKAAKPAKAAAAAEDRRGFFQVMLGSFLALGFTSLSLTSALWGLGTARFMFPNILTEPPSRFKVGFPPDFAPGQVETKFVAQFGVWVVNTEYQGQSQIVALRTVCTHLGCTPNWLEAEQKFKCPCHGSGFYKDGVNFEGPAPRPLERYAIRLADDGQIEVDKTVLFQEELGQWNDPACFIPV